jgi:plastocyanin domain-containing protein
VLTVAGITLGLPRTQVASKPAPTAASGVVRVEVNERGFFPSSVAIAQGNPVQLEFTRTNEETCATSVVFPELSITKDLPLREPVRVSVPAERERTLAFQCGVGDHRSAVIIQ